MAEYYFKDDDLEGVVTEEKRDSEANWLVPLLLIPVFIVVGWAANDLLTPERQSSQFGVGGGPVDMTTTQPFYIESPTLTPILTPTTAISPTATPESTPVDMSL